MASSSAELDNWLKLARERVKATTLAPVAEQMGRVDWPEQERGDFAGASEFRILSHVAGQTEVGHIGMAG